MECKAALNLCDRAEEDTEARGAKLVGRVSGGVDRLITVTGSPLVRSSAGGWRRLTFFRAPISILIPTTMDLARRLLWITACIGSNHMTGTAEPILATIDLVIHVLEWPNDYSAIFRRRTLDEQLLRPQVSQLSYSIAVSEKGYLGIYTPSGGIGFPLNRC